MESRQTKIGESLLPRHVCTIPWSATIATCHRRRRCWKESALLPLSSMGIKHHHPSAPEKGTSARLDMEMDPKWHQCNVSAVVLGVRDGSSTRALQLVAEGMTSLL